MSLMQLFNEKQILGACRSYRQACRRLAKAAGEIDRLGGFYPESKAAIGNGYQEDWWIAKEKVLEVRDRLLYFAETGSRAYPHVNKR